ncbi:hypothetical protein PSHT_14685 [Puccinia striiformis]|uniref:Uncharacterized protein n=1 Tax=Puccinia striiformis TaxID=27350 RepID=A0A2S4UIS1_9BASI|nr:hypothetical protein PSHT_14685 [Puccinia striiformis]
MDKDITAARSVAELSKSPDEIRKRSQRVQAGIDAELEQGAKVPLDATREAMSKLRESKNQIEAIKEEMTNRKGLPRSPKIASVSRIHRNFVATAKMVEQPIDLDYKIDRIEKLLAKDRACDAPNLLAIHYTLREVDTIRDFYENIQSLVDKYLKLISKKMEEWTQNLMKSETRLFLERTEPPEEDADQMFTMQASGIMFQMTKIGAVLEFIRSSPRLLREFCETSPGGLREFSESSPRVLRDSFKDSPRLLRDLSDTSPRLLRDFSGESNFRISSVGHKTEYRISSLATELPLIGCWWPRLSRLTTNRSFELVGWVPNQFQLACSAAELESDGTTLGDRPTEVGSDADCIGSAHASLDRLGTSQINWDAPNRCLYAGSAGKLINIVQ